MNVKIRSRFMLNYLMMFAISLVLGFFALLLMNFADDMISKNLVKNNYTAQKLMKDDYTEIDVQGVLDSGGGVQVIDTKYDIVYSAGLDTFGADKLTASQFTAFLTSSKSVGVVYSYDVLYNETKDFWLVVTFPTSLRFDFAIARNQDYPSADRQGVVTVLLSVLIFYLLLLAASTVIYSRFSSLSVVNPLKKLYEGARRLRDGDYASRVDLKAGFEFGELADIFNSMAEKIETEIRLRRQSEDNRKKLILDISHDLKNPLAAVMGYSELCLKKQGLTEEELRKYLSIVHENSTRADRLVNDLFELSKLESTQFKINAEATDICEYLRKISAFYLPMLEEKAFTLDADIPENEIMLSADEAQLDRAFQNLFANALRYSGAGTAVRLALSEEGDKVQITFEDDGAGLPEELSESIFEAFVKADDARNSQTGGTGLGLAVVKKIIEAHGGSIRLSTGTGKGCLFSITLPKSGVSI